jgi:hypothetical protein
VSRAAPLTGWLGDRVQIYGQKLIGASRLSGGIIGPYSWNLTASGKLLVRPTGPGIFPTFLEVTDNEFNTISALARWSPSPPYNIDFACEFGLLSNLPANERRIAAVHPDQPRTGRFAAQHDRRRTSDIPCGLHFLAGLERRHLNARRAVVRLGARRLLLGQALAMDGHAEGKGTCANQEQKGGPRRDYSIIPGTLLWTHCTLTNLPSGTGCLAATSIPYWRHIKGNSV